MEAVRGITDIILTPGLINVDFADVVAIMQGRGLALMGTGTASGSSRAREAAIQAINSPLLEDVRIESATGLLVNITGGPTTTLREVNEAMSMIQDAVHEETDTIFGAVIDPDMGERIKITVVATGFDHVVEVRSNERSAERTRPTRPTVARPDPLSVPPLPIEDLIEEPVLVPVYANENPGYAEASVSAGALMQRQPASASATAMAISLPERTAGQGHPAYDKGGPDLDAPAFQRHALSDTGRREPVIRNPFSVDESVGRFERPAYLRK
jgi:cell division protein FtsZ